MACGSCSKRRAAREASIQTIKKTFMDGYQQLKPSAVKSRLETFKRKFCNTCQSRFKCDMDVYLKCVKKDN